MIVRERKDSFVMIEQDQHAIVSGEMFSYWKDTYFPNKELREIVQQAIRYHDYGWKYVDQQPFWDDQKRRPYDFNSFPLASKVIIYKHGINEVEKIHPYAALLCSIHYSHFIRNGSSEYSSYFLREEKERQQRLLTMFNDLDQHDIFSHYELLSFMDSLSLYICLNEQGATGREVHRFFQKGIVLPTLLNNGRLSINWLNSTTLELNPFPFIDEFVVQLKLKIIPKDDIMNNGLIQSYEAHPYEVISYQFVPKR